MRNRIGIAVVFGLVALVLGIALYDNVSGGRRDATPPQPERPRDPVEPARDDGRKPKPRTGTVDPALEKEENAEVVALVKSKGWALKLDSSYHWVKGKDVVILRRSDNWLEGEPGSELTADEWKLLTKSKTIQVIDLRQGGVRNVSWEVFPTMPRLRCVQAGSGFTDAHAQAVAKCPHLECLTVERGELTDDGLRSLASLTELRRLELRGGTFTGASLEPLRELNALDHLSISSVKTFSDAGAAAVAGLPKLTYLWLPEECAMTSAGLRTLSRTHIPRDFSKKLIDDETLQVLVENGWLYRPGASGIDPTKPEEVRYLSLEDSKVTDAGLKLLLPQLTNLTRLDLSRTSITDATLLEVAKLKNVTTLRVEQTRITAKGLEAVLPGRYFETLDLSHCELTKDAFKAMGQMTDAGELWLCDVKTKTVWLKHLAGVKGVRELHVRGTDCGDEVAKVIASTFPDLVKLSVRDGPLTDAGLLEFGKPAKLKVVNVANTKVTEHAAKAFQNTHPQCEVALHVGW